MSSSNFQDYPKVMQHPQSKPASFKRETGEGLPKNFEAGTYDATPAFLPDLTVHSAEQEAEAAARGYVPAGESDAEAYRRGVLGVTEADPQIFREYPKWKYHLEEEPVIVKSAAEEDELGPGWADNPSGPFEEMGAAQELGTTISVPKGKARPKRAPRRATSAS